MADAALKKIKKDRLSCYICSVKLTVPINLPCLHNICYACLNIRYLSSQNKSHVICPVCKTAPTGVQGFPPTTIIPKDGVKAFPTAKTIPKGQVHDFPTATLVPTAITVPKENVPDFLITTVPKEEVHNFPKATTIPKEGIQDYPTTTIVLREGIQGFPTTTTTQKEGVQGFPTATTVPKEEVQSSLAHPMAEDPKDMVYKEENSTALEDVACLVCDKKAERHCVDCNKSLCQSCKSNHDAFTKDHHTVSIKEFQYGEVTTEGKFCKIHTDVQVRYYCETEERLVCMDCVSLYTCPYLHKRLTLKEAASKRIAVINELRKTFSDNRKKFQDAITETDSINADLTDSVEKAKTELVKCKQEYIEQVEQAFENQIREVEKVQKERVKEMKDKKKVFESEVSKLKNADNQAFRFTTISDYLIIHKYPAITKKLNALSLEKLDVVDRSIGYLQYIRVPVSAPFPGFVVKGTRWRLTNQFPLTGLEQPQAIAINRDGDMIVTSSVKGVKVFSRTGQVKHSFMEDCCKLTGVAVTHDNRYVVANGADYKGIQFHTMDGKYISNVPVSDINNDRSNINSVAVDANDQVIAGLVENTISIHYADGSLVSRFTTKSIPLRLAAISEGDIVCSFRDMSCLLMDYSGSNVRVVQPPPEVKTWVPGSMCCRKGELFVANTVMGDPVGIFRYTAEGHYLGCVTTEVRNPGGIALSPDGMELFVLDYFGKQVKIFHRE